MWTSVCCGWLLPQCFGGGLAVILYAIFKRVLVEKPHVPSYAAAVWHTWPAPSQMHNAPSVS